MFFLRLNRTLNAILQQGTQIMSVISDFAAKQTAFNTEVASDLAALNAQIVALQNSQGTVTPEDQTLIDGLVTDGAALQTQADTLAGKTPPAPPAGG